MKFSEQWLREYVDTRATLDELAESLTMTGLEVKSISPVAGPFQGVIVGHVLKVEPHPQADRLRVCHVHTGDDDQPRLIVCGASNVRENLKVAVATVGATLPNGQIIKAAKLRGIESQGMLCSSNELSLTTAFSSEGILELPEEAPVGQDLRAWLQCDDHVMDVHVTPNRGDCLSVLGVAREVVALGHGTLRKQVDVQMSMLVTPEDTGATKVSIQVDEPAACPRYLGCVISGIDTQAKTPAWMQERLQRSGLRSVHPVVDVTNYVLLERGQPLHAFDLDAIQEGIRVRRAKPGEKITLLDERVVTLDSETLIIADQQKPLAIAGVMGGLTAAVTKTTTAIFLEAAYFDPIAIAAATRSHRLNTDASYRFERGVDPDLCQQAINYAAHLLMGIVKGQVSPVVEIASSHSLPPSSSILLRQTRIERLLGIALSHKEIEVVLQRLNMRWEKHAEGWLIVPPSYRFDVKNEADLIEEIARIHGYQNIPCAAPRFSSTPLVDHAYENTVSRMKHLLVSRGYAETITYSFISSALHNVMTSTEAALTLVNPISADHAVMRSSLWPGLLQAAVYNQNRQQMRVRLFETGLCFSQDADVLKQEPWLAGVAIGDAFSEQWGIQRRPTDFFDLKAEVESLLQLNNLSNILYVQAQHSALHPEQSSEIVCLVSSNSGTHQQTVGRLAALHPQVAHTLGLTGPVYLFELQLNKLISLKGKSSHQFQNFSKFPAIRRDISFWIDCSVTVQAVFDAIRLKGGPWLVAVNLFDVYQEKNTASHQRSLALSLLWQRCDQTLLDTEVEALMQQILEYLGTSFKINLRAHS